MGLKFVTVPIFEVFLTDPERCAMAGPLSLSEVSRFLVSRHITGYLLARWGSTSSLRHPLWNEVFALSGCTRHEADRFPVPISRLFYIVVYVLSQFVAVSFASQIL